LDRKMQQLLEDPITHVEEMFRGMGPAELNGKGQGLCRDMRLVTAKYPFNPKSSAQATIADVNSLFQPKEGALWKFYEANLQKLIVLQGSQYGPAPGATVRVTPAFLGFFNRAAAFSKALYPEGATDPHLTFKLKPVKIEGIDGVSVQIDGQTLSYNGSGEGKTVTLVWPGAAHEVKATTTPVYPWFTEPGLWAVYDFLSGADRVQPAGSVSHLEYDVVARVGNNPRNQASATPRFVSFDLDMGANPPIFQKGYLSSLGCVAEVAK
jgi:type VI secretion system protein ImpL